MMILLSSKFVVLKRKGSGNYSLHTRFVPRWASRLNWWFTEHVALFVNIVKVHSHCFVCVEPHIKYLTECSLTSIPLKIVSTPTPTYISSQIQCHVFYSNNEPRDYCQWQHHELFARMPLFQSYRYVCLGRARERESKKDRERDAVIVYALHHHVVVLAKYTMVRAGCRLYTPRIKSTRFYNWILNVKLFQYNLKI